MPPDALSFLIDECLHASLVGVANEKGYVAHHVEHLGLKGAPDWQLWKRAIKEEWIFVTNNAQDFRKLYRRAQLHAGFILLLPMVRPEVQKQLFRAALDHLGPRKSLANRVIEVDLLGERAIINELELP